MDGTREISGVAAHLARRGAVKALDLLFPPLCVACRGRVSESHSLCPACWNAVSFIEGAVCACCGSPFDIDPGGDTMCGACHAHAHDFTRARALLRYDDASKPLILGFKYGDRLARITTGATLDACARALKRAGAARVDALTLARVVRTVSGDI
jgi:predicted amidophosphoribosyltransferase